MTEAEFETKLDEWIEDFRAEARRAFATGCHVPDLLNIGMAFANSRMNRRVSERAGVQVFPGLPELSRRNGH